MRNRIWMLISILALVLAACGGAATSDTAPAGGDDQTTTTASTEGTSSGTEASKGPVTIRYFTFSAAPDHLEDLDAMIAAFNQEYPEITVEVETAPFDEYFSSLQTQIAGDDAPDAFELNFENFVSFASKGALADLSPLMTADAELDLSVYYQRALGAFTFNDAQYALPESYSTVVLYYNKDLFDRAGLDYPTDDWTWAEERAAAEVLAALDDNVWGHFSGIHYWEFYKAAFQNGCDFFTDGEVTINQPACTEALQYMLDYVNDGIQPSAADMGGIPDEQMFASGQLGMDTNGIWQFATFQDAPFDWDIVVEPGNTRGGSHFFANGVGVSASSEQKEAAYTWLRFFTSSPEAAQIRVGASWELPTLTDESLYVDYLSIEPPANREAVLKSLENVVVPPVIERQAEMQDAINGVIERAAAGEITAQEALDLAKAEIEALLG